MFANYLLVNTRHLYPEICEWCTNKINEIWVGGVPLQSKASKVYLAVNKSLNNTTDTIGY